VRSVATCWASLVGALVWHRFGPEALLYVAFGCGAAGAAVFYLSRPRRVAVSPPLLGEPPPQARRADTRRSP
jgi:hypothetical protein